MLCFHPPWNIYAWSPHSYYSNPLSDWLYIDDMHQMSLPLVPLDRSSSTSPLLSIVSYSFSFIYSYKFIILSFFSNISRVSKISIKSTHYRRTIYRNTYNKSLHKPRSIFRWSAPPSPYPIAPSCRPIVWPFIVSFFITHKSFCHSFPGPRRIPIFTPYMVRGLGDRLGRVIGAREIGRFILRVDSRGFI